MVGDVVGQHVEPVDARRRCAARSPRMRCRLPRRRCVPPRPWSSAARNSACGRCARRYAWHCAVATGIDSTALTSAERRARPGQQAVLDVEHDLALDQQVVVEGQLVLREVDHSLDRVLDRTKPKSTSPASTASSTSGIVRYNTCSAAARSGCDLQGLLGERAERPEKADLRRWVDHMSQVIGGTPCNRPKYSRRREGCRRIRRVAVPPSGRRHRVGDRARPWSVDAGGVARRPRCRVDRPGGRRGRRRRRRLVRGPADR